jgi:hypothetical protein
MAVDKRAELDAAVKASFDESGGTPGTYGSPRVFADLIEAVGRCHGTRWRPRWPVRAWWAGPVTQAP